MVGTGALPKVTGGQSVQLGQTHYPSILILTGQPELAGRSAEIGRLQWRLAKVVREGLVERDSALSRARPIRFGGRWGAATVALRVDQPPRWPKALFAASELY